MLMKYYLKSILCEFENGNYTLHVTKSARLSDKTYVNSLFPLPVFIPCQKNVFTNLLLLIQSCNAGVKHYLLHKGIFYLKLCILLDTLYLARSSIRNYCNVF